MPSSRTFPAFRHLLRDDAPVVACLHHCRHWLCVVWLLLVLASGPAPAIERTGIGHQTVTQWAVEDGLPHNLPLGISQDRRGRMWIATWEGVARFNGHAFLVFDRRTSGGIDLAGSTALLPEADGSMLVGNDKGVFRYRHGTWSVLDPRLAGVPCEVLYRTHDGTLWVVSHQRLLALSPDGHLREVPLGNAPVQVFSLSQLDDGSLLIGAETGLFRLQGRQLVRHAAGQGLDGATVFHILDVSPGWLLSTSRGLWRLDGRSGLQPMGVEARVNRTVRDPSGRLWLNLHEGDLMVLSPDGRKERFPLPGLRSRSLFVDRDGAIWGGTTQGTFRIAPGAAQPVADSGGYVRAVLEDAAGTLWLGHGGGLRRIGRDGAAREVVTGSVLSLALASDGKGVWAGTYEQGVLRLDAEGHVRQRLQPFPGRTSGLIRAVAQTDDGTLWIGSGVSGLYRWKNGQSTPVLRDGKPLMALVLAVVPDHAGGVWVGGGEGFAHVAADGHVRLWGADAALPAKTVFDFHQEASGTLWMATDKGLVRWHAGRFDVFDGRHGLPREKLFRLLSVGGYFWVSSNRGVFRIDRRELSAILAGTRSQLSVAVVDNTDGIPGGQGNGGSWPAGWQTQEGSLLFPTDDGVGRVDPARVASRQLQSVPVEIERVMVDGVLANPVQALRVPADTRRLVVSYTGLAYQAPERVRYRYRLVGFDPGWYESGSIGQTVFTNLPPGHYRFEVEAMVLPLDWNDRQRVGSRVLEITVKAPLWQHPMATLMGVGGLLVLVYGMVGLRVTRFRARQQRLNQIIEERTDELVEKNFALQVADREREALLQQLAYQASHDALTDLPNRRAADAHLREAVERATHTGRQLAVALLDLDFFKQINDTHGHDAGDAVLAALGQRLRALSGNQVFAARLGGEEFVVVIENRDDAVVRHWLQALRSEVADTPVPLPDGSEVACSLSAGVAFLHRDGSSAGTLLSAADARLYEAKRAGRNRVVG